MYELIGTIALVVNLSFIGVDLFASYTRRPTLLALRIELRPFAVGSSLYIATMNIFLLEDESHTVAGLIWIFNAWIIWYLKKWDDDDRWKKRRKKLAAKVKEVGKKLVVVPLPQPQGA